MGDAALTRPDQTRPDQAGFLGRLTRTQPTISRSNYLPACLPRWNYLNHFKFTYSSLIHSTSSYTKTNTNTKTRQDQDQAQLGSTPLTLIHPSPQSSLPTPTSGGGGGGGGCLTIASPPSHLGLSQPFIDIDIAIHQ
ncbi:uncharacterized protein RSE6_09403 [Rhynchosporium secalis]|uniref:Uncharacterized protein n=1 Tax=Rhynchosporium secalis TaxID=38038 RepID=A0A1E1MHU2_RHYSE|nr:uncharacterized protein RSE6_09403 [Rhynchosporium secalis]